jgi:ribosomal subunit interface protein
LSLDKTADIMKTLIHYKNIPEASRPGLQQRVRELAERHLKQHLSRFKPELVLLHAELEKNTHHQHLHAARLRLELPGTTLTTNEEGAGVGATLRAAFDELERQLTRHIERMRGDDQWRRKERREELRALKKGA